MFKRQIKIYRRLARHPGTPRAAKFCFGSAIGYLLLPFDWIPDFLPVSGHLDDALIVPALVALARRQYSRRALPRSSRRQRLKKTLTRSQDSLKRSALTLGQSQNFPVRVFAVETSARTS